MVCVSYPRLKRRSFLAQPTVKYLIQKDAVPAAGWVDVRKPSNNDKKNNKPHPSGWGGEGRRSAGGFQVFDFYFPLAVGARDIAHFAVCLPLVAAFPTLGMHVSVTLL